MSWYPTAHAISGLGVGLESRGGGGAFGVDGFYLQAD